MKRLFLSPYAFLVISLAPLGYAELVPLDKGTFLETDSTNYDALPTVSYSTVTLNSDKSVLRSRRHEIDCSSLARRTMFGTMWSPWITATDSLANSARILVCAYWTPERWTFMFEKENGRFLIDRSTIDSVAKIRFAKRVWIKIENDTAELGSRAIPIKSVMSRYEFNCTQRRMRTLASYEYSSKGNVLSSFEAAPDSASWSSIIPDSRGEEMSEWVCNVLPLVNKIAPVKRR